MEQMTARPTESPLERALEQVGDRWTLLVVHALLDGPKRFNELSSVLPGIAPNVLSQRLKHLERIGILVAELYSVRPPRFAYEVTAAGKELAGTLQLLAQWGSNRGGEAGGPDHGTCGTAMEARWWCPTCERTVDEHEDDKIRFV